MSSTALYKAFIEVGASEKAATEAAEDIIQVSQLPQLATKTDIASLKSDIARVEVKMAEVEARFIKWMVGSMFVFAGNHRRRRHCHSNHVSPWYCPVICGVIQDTHKSDSRTCSLPELTTRPEDRRLQMWVEVK